MKTLIFLQSIPVFLLISFFSNVAFSKEFMVYSISQEVSMGEANEKVKKNYYINMGGDQGLRKGVLLDVYRTISRVDSYDVKQRYQYKIKIGEVKVIHVENQSSIGVLTSLRTDLETPLFEIPTVIIGDRVGVKVN